MAEAVKITIWEVGPRDGLQNESQTLPPQVRAEFVAKLAEAGLAHLEVGAFVSPKAVPQMAGTDEVFAELAARELPAGLVLSALVPNERGLEYARRSGLREIAIFTAASDEFNRRNINTDIEGSFARLTPVVRQALAEGMRVRAYLSTVVECPYEGKVEPRKVAELTARLLELGCYQVSLGETLGVAVPDEIAAVIEACLSLAAPEQLALHLHDTYGTALASAMVGLRMGITTFDTSAGGLGGCPFAPGAAGNLATEDLVYALERMGYETGIDLDGLVEATRFIHQHLPHPPRSRAWQALQGRFCSG